MYPLVSILIPNYNKAKFLNSTLKSISNQLFQNWECIVVDDHSTDESWSILEKWSHCDSRFKVVRRPHYLQKGGNTCRNLAFDLSKGKYIQWFDSDDLFLDDALRNRVFEMERDNSLEFLISHGLFCSEVNMESLEIVISPIMHNNLLESFILLDPPYLIQSVIFRKEFLTRIGVRWATEMQTLQDIQYNFICLVKSKKKMISNKNIDWCWRKIENRDSVSKLALSPKYFNAYFELASLFFLCKISKIDIARFLFVSFRNLGYKKEFYRNVLNPSYINGFISYRDLLLFKLISFNFPFIMQRLFISVFLRKNHLFGWKSLYSKVSVSNFKQKLESIPR